VRQGATIFAVSIALGAGFPGLAAASTPQGPQQLTNAKIADVAIEDVGKSRPAIVNGKRWNAPGQCLEWVQRWVREAGAAMKDSGGRPLSAFEASPAVQVSESQARRGDVFQISKGDTLNGRPHTGILLGGRRSNGTFDVVEGNVPADSGKVRTNRRVLSTASWVPAGHKLTFWRFGKVPAPKAKSKPNPLKRYADKIVQWSGDKKAQKTAWLVGSDLKRRWIPDIATYNCLKARGVPGPVKLPAKTLDKLKDLRDVRANCTPPPPPVAAPPPPPPAPVPKPAPKPIPKPAPKPTPKPTPPPRTVTLSKGGSAQGLPGCKSSYCRYMAVSFKNFSSGNHSITCRASNGSEGGFFTYTRSGSSGSSAVCYYGFPGHKVWVTVDGVSSNKITW
jgi:hypothetical protein